MSKKTRYPFSKKLGGFGRMVALGNAARKGQIIETKEKDGERSYTIIVNR